MKTWPRTTGRTRPQRHGWTPPSPRCSKWRWVTFVALDSTPNRCETAPCPTACSSDSSPAAPTPNSPGGPIPTTATAPRQGKTATTLDRTGMADSGHLPDCGDSGRCLSVEDACPHRRSNTPPPPRGIVSWPTAPSPGAPGTIPLAVVVAVAVQKTERVLATSLGFPLASRAVPSSADYLAAGTGILAGVAFCTLSTVLVGRLLAGRTGEERCERAAGTRGREPAGVAGRTTSPGCSGAATHFLPHGPGTLVARAVRAQRAAPDAERSKTPVPPGPAGGGLSARRPLPNEKVLIIGLDILQA